jgi:pyruvate kinase
VTLTESGFTSRSISKFRPSCPILAVTPTEEVVRRLSMNWGVNGMRAPEGHSDTELLAFAIERGRQLGFIQRGDLLVVTHGVEREAGSTSMVRVLTVSA